MGIETEHPISEATTAFQFPTGKSYFAAFQLPPESSSASEVELKTYLVAKPPNDSQLLCPTVTFYDKDFQLISTDISMLSYFSTQSENSGYWRSQLSIPNGSKFMVVHTEPQRVGNLLAVSTAGSGPYLAFMGAVPVYFSPGGPGQRKFQCGYLGEISLVVK